MIPWKHLDSGNIPNGGKLDLWARDGEFVIRAEHRALMTSREHESEEALAQIACRGFGGQDVPRVLIGGLGMGFTLRAALRELPPQACVVVAELVPAVVDWNLGPIGHLAGHPLRDPRVEVREQDVALVLRGATAEYDVVLLDVDNGPEGLTHESNDWLYGPAGLSAARRALRAGGLLAVWSASDEPEFTRRLGASGFEVRAIRVRAASGAKGRRHTIWIARRPSKD